jgi:hypothetical protein
MIAETFYAVSTIQQVHLTQLEISHDRSQDTASGCHIMTLLNRSYWTFGASIAFFQCPSKCPVSKRSDFLDQVAVSRWVPGIVSTYITDEAYEILGCI